MSNAAAFFPADITSVRISYYATISTADKTPYFTAAMFPHFST
jgi:hypothetical protein